MAGKRIIVLFNLKPGKSVSAYEAWAKAKDLPTVNTLKSVDSFEVYRSAGLLGGEGKPPFQYIEIIDVNDMKQFDADVSTSGMQAIAREFGEIAEAVFVLSEKL